MNLAILSRYEKAIMSPSTSLETVDNWINELKGRASAVGGHYRGKLDEFRFATNLQRPATGLLGEGKGFFVSMDIENGYQFQSEYLMLFQEFGALGYSGKLKTSDSVDPSAISNIMTMVFEKRKAFEDRTMTLLGSINAVLKSVIAITYELRELDRNLQFYNLLKSTDKEKKTAAELALKRIFVDQVDARKRGASLVALSNGYTQGQGGAGFIDLVASFYKINSLRDITSMQRNAEYKDILKNRYLEYEEWKKLSGVDIKQRRSMLLQYLKSQVSSFKLYSEWAAESLTILKRINMTGIKDAKSYMAETKKLDIFERAKFGASFIAWQPLYAKDISVETAKVFGNKGAQLPIRVMFKSPVSAPITQGPKESSRAFTYKRLMKYGPKVVLAIETDISFMEKQFFAKGVPQERPQYNGTLDIKLTPYCFTLDEWYLFKRAQEAKINKTVFSGLDSVAVSSFGSIQKELDKYIEEAEKESVEKPAKKSDNYAFVDIYRAFKDDILGINKALSSFAPSTGRGPNTFKPETYEIEISHRKFNAFSMKSAIEVGMLVAMEDSSLIYDEFKRRKNLLTPLSKFDNPLF